MMKGLGWLMALGMFSSTATASAETRFALAVGHNLGHEDEVPLRWAEEDARRVRAVFEELGDVAPHRAFVLFGPSREALDSSLARLRAELASARQRGERTVLFFYYSGHADEHALHLGFEPMPMAELEVSLNGLGATTVVAILDACRNDRNPRAQSKGARRAPGFDWPTTSAPSPEGFVQLRSASRGEIAQESDELQGSLFSHHLLSGLRGSADADRDGVVTLGEVYSYGYRRTLEDSHREAPAVQHGELELRLLGQGELVMTYPRRAEAQLSFGDDVIGHLLIVDDATGRIVAELVAKPGRERSLAVRSGRYRIQLRRGREFRTGLVRVERGRLVVGLANLTRQDALTVLRKGAGHDPHPWAVAVAAGVGRGAVRGFDTLPFASLGIEWRWQPELRLVTRGYVGHQGVEGNAWRLEQVEWGVGAGIDWSFLRAARWDARIGLRGGVLGIVQSGQRVDAERFESAEIDDVRFELSNAGWGPDVALPLSVDAYPWTELGLRLTVSPSLRWLPVGGSWEARWGLSVELGGVIWP